MSKVKFTDIVYQWLLENGPATSAEIAHGTGLSLKRAQGTVDNLRVRGGGVFGFMAQQLEVATR